MNPVEVAWGDGPIVLGLPHTGLWLPEDALARLNGRGRALADTDWRIEKLYDGLAPGLTMVRATFHRYLIDANRDPGGASLYPGRNTTALCPVTDFDGEPIYREGEEPDAAEISRRIEHWHAPYHAALKEELERARARHGAAILYDCHSIRSRIPFLFEGRLPDFNIGTDSGRSCAPVIEAAVADICAGAPGYTMVANGRFKGGWTTRHYGRPETGVHAVQMELAQSTYLEKEAPPWALSEAGAGRLRRHLSDIMKNLAALAPTLRGEK